MSKIQKFKPKQLVAIDAYASNPMQTYSSLGREIGVNESTIRNWFSNPTFIDACYNRYMEVAGIELPQVVQAMVREAKEGNVHAGRLVLEHFGKLEKKIKIEIESPWEKFIKADETEFIDVTPQDTDTIMEMSDEIEGNISELPARNPANDYPRKRLGEEKERLNITTKYAQKKQSMKEKQHELYNLRKRAEKVGLPLLGRGRHSKGRRKEWLRELERLESLGE